MELYLERKRGQARVTIGRHVFEASVDPWRPEGFRKSTARGAPGRSVVKAPMTGSIVEVRVVPGEVVEKGDVVLIIESMKMNNELRAPVSGTVESVAVKAGDRVKQGDALVVVNGGEASAS
jgi:biotin carboxyl carrier protein